MQLKQQQTLNPSQDQMNALANLYHSNQASAFHSPTPCR